VYCIEDCTVRAGLFCTVFSRLILHCTWGTPNKGASIWNLVPISGHWRFGHGTTSVAKHDKNKRPASAFYWQHLATTLDVARCYLHLLMIVACWSHTASSSMHVLRDGRKAATRGSSASADILVTARRCMQLSENSVCPSVRLSHSYSASKHTMSQSTYSNPQLFVRWKRRLTSSRERCEVLRRACNGVRMSVCTLGYLTNHQAELQLLKHAACGSGSVLLWRRCATLCTSNFVQRPYVLHDGPYGALCVCFTLDSGSTRT